MKFVTAQQTILFLETFHDDWVSQPQQALIFFEKKVCMGMGVITDVWGDRVVRFP